jgi:hypothetical protein
MRVDMSGRTVFVVMPISARTDDLWHLGIRETCARLGWNCTRADAITEPGFIVTQIHGQLSSADVVIGEMSERNPNVFYEIGYAHALGKHTILLAGSSEDLIAFDTQGFRHFLHSGSAFRVRKILEEVLPAVESHVCHTPSVPGGETLYEWPSPDYSPPRLQWTARGQLSKKQLDIYGGQAFQPLPGIGEVLNISNTEKNWNHHQGTSIVTLGRWTHELRRGDRVLVMLDGRADASAQLSFYADGGWLNSDTKDIWVFSWKQVDLRIGPQVVWIPGYSTQRLHRPRRVTIRPRAVRRYI